MTASAGVRLGFIVAVIVAFSMAISSLVLTNIEVGKVVEALFQNFAAGLILAAVAAELFPLMITGVTESQTWGGVSAGFAVGLLLVYGIEPFIEWLNGLSCLQAKSSGLTDQLVDVDHIVKNIEGGDDKDLSKRSTKSAVSVSAGSRRYASRLDADAPTGTYLSLDLVIPVTMDCFVDGFLIGVSCALQPKAGYTLGLANTLEMSFLGMAYASSIKKCTKSSLLMRSIALYAPPALMALAGGLGGYLAGASSAVPEVFVGFVAFGVIALVALVCGELIVEAKETIDEYQEETGQDYSYVSLTLYAGIYFVLMMTRVI